MADPQHTHTEDCPSCRLKADFFDSASALANDFNRKGLHALDVIGALATLIGSLIETSGPDMAEKVEALRYVGQSLSDGLSMRGLEVADNKVN